MRYTTANGMKAKGFSLHPIASVTGHMNYESLKSYLEAPDEEEKEEFCNALFDYAYPSTNQEKQQKQQEDPQPKNVQEKVPENPVQNNELSIPNEDAIVIEVPQQPIQHEIVNLNENQVAIADVPVGPALPNVIYNSTTDPPHLFSRELHLRIAQ